MSVVVAVGMMVGRDLCAVRFLDVRVQVDDQISDAQLPLVVVIVEVGGCGSVAGRSSCCGGWRGTFQFALEADRAIRRDPSGVPRGVG